MRVGVDLDGCVYDFASGLRAYLCRALGWDEKDCPDPTVWEFYRHWGLDTDAFLTACHDAVDDGMLWTQGETFPGAVEAVRRLYEVGHEIVVITDRHFGTDPADSRTQTIAWAEQVGLPYDELFISADKTVAGVEVMCEDRVDHYVALLGAGVHPVLIDRPWNRSSWVERRVPDVPAYARAVMTLDEMRESA